jgi:hypothetical protein
MTGHDKQKKKQKIKETAHFRRYGLNFLNLEVKVK